MQKQAPKITCIVKSQSPEKLRAAEKLAQQTVALDNTFVDVAVAFPNGVETKRTERHRLGDYFDAIQVRQSEDHTFFTMVFQAKPDAGSVWKDLVVWAVRVVRESASGVSVGAITRTK